MLSISNVLVLSRMKKALSRSNIEIIHYIPGRIRLKCLSWRGPHSPSKLVVTRLKDEPRINSISWTEETGSLLIEFDKSVLEDVGLLEQWINEIERLSEVTKNN